MSLPTEADTPTLLVSDLKLLGLLDRTGRNGLVVETCGIKFLLTSSTGGERIRVSCIIEGHIRESWVDIVWHERSFGERAYFECSATRKRCSELYFDGSMFVHRSSMSLSLKTKHKPQEHRRVVKLAKAYARVTGQDGRKPARGQNRMRLMLLLERDPLAREYWPDLRWRIEQEREKRVRAERGRSRSRLSNGAMSTRAGLVSYRSAEVSPAFKQREEWSPPPTASLVGYTIPGMPQSMQRIDWGRRRSSDDDEWLKTLPTIRAPASPPSVGRIERFPCLDMQTILENVQDHSVGLLTFGLKWSLAEEEVTFSVLFPSQPRVAEWVYVRRDYPDGRPYEGQLLRSTRTGGRRHLFECPLTKAKCERLFYRDGIFASAKAHRLINCSQRK